MTINYVFLTAYHIHSSVERARAARRSLGSGGSHSSKTKGANGHKKTKSSEEGKKEEKKDDKDSEEDDEKEDTDEVEVQSSSIDLEDLEQGDEDGNVTLTVNVTSIDGDSPDDDLTIEYEGPVSGVMTAINGMLFGGGEVDLAKEVEEEEKLKKAEEETADSDDRRRLVRRVFRRHKY